MPYNEHLLNLYSAETLQQFEEGIPVCTPVLDKAEQSYAVLGCLRSGWQSAENILLLLTFTLIRVDTRAQVGCLNVMDDAKGLHVLYRQNTTNGQFHHVGKALTELCYRIAMLTGSMHISNESLLKAVGFHYKQGMRADDAALNPHIEAHLAAHKLPTSFEMSSGKRRVRMHMSATGFEHWAAVSGIPYATTEEARQQQRYRTQLANLYEAQVYVFGLAGVTVVPSALDLLKLIFDENTHTICGDDIPAFLARLEDNQATLKQEAICRLEVIEDIIKALRDKHVRHGAMPAAAVPPMLHSMDADRPTPPPASAPDKLLVTVKRSVRP